MTDPRTRARLFCAAVAAVLAGFLFGARAGVPALTTAQDARPPRAAAPRESAPREAAPRETAPQDAPPSPPPTSPPTTAAAERERAREALRRDLAADVARLESFSRAFRGVAKLVSPSVVHIRVAKEAVVSEAADPFMDPRLRRFFGLPEPEEPALRGRSRRVPVQQGEGSGVVYSADGYILTNNHVVGGADRITVRFEDGRELPARIIGVDPKIDLALVKVEAVDLLPIEMAPSGAVDVGDWVVAVGNPFGLQHTVTAGIVSAIHRAGVGITDYESFIQTDAAINPGNSGGPLVDLRGRLVGINTAIASKTGGFQGVGFALPVEMVRTFAPQLMAHGRARRGWLGVSIQPVDAELAARFTLPEAKGALVSGVLAGGPAGEAGLRAGDVIVSVEGTAIDSPNALRNRVAGLQPGTSVKVGLYRDGRLLEAKVALGELEDETAGALPPLERTPPAPRPASPERPAATPPGATPTTPRGPAASAPEDGGKLGFSVRALTPALARRLGLPSDAKGVLVDAVEPGSPAEMIGLERGDVIEEVDRRPTPDLDAFDAAMSAPTPDGARLFLVRRGETTSFVRLRVR